MVLKTYTQEQVDQMLKLASAGINITVERVEGKEGKPEKEEEKHDSPRSLRATPYVAPPSISTDMMKVEMGKSIVLSSLKGDALKKWGNQVKGYESSYGRYDRNRIEVEIRDKINYRWNSSLYVDNLPERLRASREGEEETTWTWLSHDVISSEELTSFLLATVSSGTGHDVGDQKHELVNQWLKTQSLSFTTEGLQESWENFILGWDKTMALHITNVQEMSSAHHKGMTKELENMVFRSANRNDTIPHLAMAFMLPFENKLFRQVNILIKELDDAFNGVMKSVIKNQLFNAGLFKTILERHGSEQKKPPEGEKGKDGTKSIERGNDKRKGTSDTQSSSSSKSHKMSHSEKRVAHRDTDTVKPLCPACGAYSSEKHDPHLNKDSCFWVKDNIDGHNRAWKEIPWLDSKEYKELIKTGKTFLGNAKNRKDAPTNREGEYCISCNPILNHLSNLSLTLPLINILIPSPLQEQKGERIKLRAGRDLKELSRDQAFLDYGAQRGNLISPGFAEN